MTGVGEGSDPELKSSAMEDRHQQQHQNQCTDKKKENINNKEKVEEEESISSSTEAKPLYPPPHFSPYNFYPPPPANFPLPDASASSADVYPPPAYPPPPPTGSMQGPSPFHHQWPPVEPHGYPSWPHWPYQPHPYPCFNSYSYPYPCYPPIHHHQPHHDPHPHPHCSTGDYDGVQNPIAFGSEQVGANGMNTCAPAAVGVEEIGNPNELYPPLSPVPHISPGVQGGEAGLEALVRIAAFIQQQFAAARDAVKPQVDVEVEGGGIPTPTPSSVLPQETEEEEEKDSSVKVAAANNQQTPVEQLNKSLSHPSEEQSLHPGYPSYDYSSSQYQYDQQALYPPPSSYCNPYPPSYNAPSWGGPTTDPSVVSESTNDPAQENSKPIPEHSYDQALYPPPPQHHHYPYYPPPHYGPGFPAPPPPVFSDPTNSAGDIPSNSGKDYWNTQHQQHHHQYPHFPPFPPFPHPHCHYPPCWSQPSSSGPWQNQNYNSNQFPQPQPQQPNFPSSTPPPMLYPDAKHPYTQYFKDLIKSFTEAQKTNLEVDGTVEHQTW